MTKQEDTDNGLTRFFIVAIILSALLYLIRKDIQELWNSVTSIFRAISNFISSQLFLVILGIIVLTILVYFIIKLIRTIKRKTEEKKTKAEEINKEAKEIDKILDENLDMSSEGLEEFIEKIK